MNKINILSRFIEAQADKRSATVIIIKEGKGNKRDKHYYSKDAMNSSYAIFEGAQCYADHPTKIDEANRPERSIRELIGYFRNVKASTDADGKAIIMGDLQIVEGDSYNWAWDLVKEAASYAKSYPDKNLVGISINADGDSEPKDIDGETWNVVTKITNAFSADVVTRPAAGGKILNFKESLKSKEVSPPGWDDKMKTLMDNPKIDNPWALSWYIYGKQGKTESTSQTSMGALMRGQEEMKKDKGSIEFVKKTYESYIDNLDDKEVKKAMSKATEEAMKKASEIAKGLKGMKVKGESEADDKKYGDLVDQLMKILDGGASDEDEGEAEGEGEGEAFPPKKDGDDDKAPIKHAEDCECEACKAAKQAESKESKKESKKESDGGKDVEKLEQRIALLEAEKEIRKENELIDSLLESSKLPNKVTKRLRPFMHGKTDKQMKGLIVDWKESMKEAVSDIRPDANPAKLFESTGGNIIDDAIRSASGK